MPCQHGRQRHIQETNCQGTVNDGAGLYLYELELYPQEQPRTLPVELPAELPRALPEELPVELLEDLPLGSFKRLREKYRKPMWNPPKDASISLLSFLPHTTP